jgi:hypothetical protein
MVTRHRVMAIEAIAVLTAARLALLLLPFSWIAGAAGRVDGGHARDLPRRATTDRVSLEVRSALRAGVRRLPWHSTCLARAIAGRLMLGWRGTPTTLVLGVAPNGESVAAHAWLIAADGYVCGGREAQRFRPLAAIRS